MLQVNNSLLTLLATCETKTWLRWGQELVMKEQDAPGPMEVGSVLHRVFEVWLHEGDILAAFNDAWDDLIGDRLPKIDRLQRQNVLLTLQHWVNAQAMQPKDFTLVKSEYTFEVPFGTINGEEVIYHGTIDGLVEWKGELYVLEHKTTGLMDSEWAASWEMSSQPQGYLWGLRQLGYPVKGVLINGLQISKLPPWDGNMEKKCATHKCKYKDCQQAHIKHAWIGPLWWSDNRLDLWRVDVMDFVARLQAIQHTNDPVLGAMVKMDGQFKWPGCKRCQYRSWCKAGRPIEGLHDMMIHQDWLRNPTSTSEEDEY